jgi:hypothetical protein
MASRPPPRGAGVAELRRNLTRLPRPLPRRSCTRTEPTGGSRPCALRGRGALRTARRHRRASIVEPAAAGPQRWVHPVAGHGHRSHRRSPLDPRRLTLQRFLRFLTGRPPTSYPGTAPRPRSPLSAQPAVPPTPSRSTPHRSIPNPSSSPRPLLPRSERRRSCPRRLGPGRLHLDRLGFNPLRLNQLGPNQLVLNQLVLN